MDEHQIELQPLLWAIGWLVAVLVLFWAGLRLPLQTRLVRWQNWIYTGGVVVVAFALFVLANVALTLHDGHIDLTREKLYTPSAAAMKVVDGLEREVRLTYFYHSQDPAGRRARDILTLMQRRNPLFRLTAVDPDKEPTVARTNGIRIYNAAMIEADGRRVLVQSTDEAEIALGIQRVLRERVITVCFVEGHGELPMDNFEFHTHLEGVACSSLMCGIPGRHRQPLRDKPQPPKTQTLPKLSKPTASQLGRIRQDRNLRSLTLENRLHQSQRHQHPRHQS
jgi:gliding motility-associatede transport system auxiliary component